MLTPGNLNSVTANISDQSETENCYVSVMEETAFITESGLEVGEQVLSTAALTDDLTTAATLTCSTQDVFTDVYTDQNLNQWENIKMFSESDLNFAKSFENNLIFETEKYML